MTSNDWQQICQNVTNIAKPFFSIPFPTTVKSAILSSLFEIEAAKYYQSKGFNVKNSTNDTELDLYFQDTNTPIEIKVTKLSKTIKFRGNKVSKRESQFDIGLKFYVTTLYLRPSDWLKECENYNASFLSYKSITDKITDLVGNVNNLREYK